MTGIDRLLFVLAFAAFMVVGAVGFALAVAAAGLTALVVLGWKP